MDPLSIACGCVSLIAGVTNLLTKITIFTLEVKAARKDMDAVSRELVSLKLCLMGLEDDEQRRRVSFPPELKKQINEILVNIDIITHQISEVLLKLSLGRLGRKIQYASESQHEIAKLRSSLESNKTALEVALTVGSISMLTDQRQKIVDQGKDLATILGQTTEISTTAIKIDQKIDNLTELQKDHTQFRNITREIAELRAQLTHLSKSNQSTQSLQHFS